MSFYRFSHDSPAGRLEGYVEAASSEQLTHHLKGLGLTGVTIEKVPDFQKFCLRTPARSELARFLSQLSMAANSGVPLVKALEAAGTRRSGKALHGLTRYLLHGLESGQTLHSMLATLPRHFPESVVGLVKCGEQSGGLIRSLHKSAELLEQSQSLRNRLKSALLYPSFVLVVFFLVLSVFTLYLVPVFSGVFLSFGVELPATLRVTTNISQFLSQPWNIFLLAQAAVLLAIPIARWVNSDQGAMFLDQFLMEAPVLRGFYRDYQMAQLTLILAEVLTAGIDLLTCLKLARSGVTSARVRSTLDFVSEEISYGHNFHEVLKRDEWAPHLLCQMVEMGEETGRLPLVFTYLNKLYTFSFERRIELFLQLIEPVIMGFMGGLVGLFVLSFMGPIFRLLQVVG